MTTTVLGHRTDSQIGFSDRLGSPLRGHAPIASCRPLQVRPGARQWVLSHQLSHEHDRQRSWSQLFWQAADRSADVADSFAPRQLSAPVKLLRKLLATWQLSQTDAVRLLGYDSTDPRPAFDILEGRVEPRGRDVKDRIVCLYQIRKTLDSLLRNEQVENQWLRERHEGLYRDRPMDLLLEGSIENILLVRDYVEATAGM